MSSDYYGQIGRIPWFDQKRLRQKAAVVVVGAGSLGNWVLLHLVLNGVGIILINDRDIVQESDLPRSPLFRRADIGRAKVEVAASRLRSMNKQVRLIPVFGDVEYDLGLGEFRRADVVVGAVDSRRARLQINKRSWAAGVPYVDGGVDGASLTGRVQVFYPPVSACLECAWYDGDYSELDSVQPCSRTVPAGHGAPTFSTIAALVGAALAHEVLGLLLGLDHGPRAAREIRYHLPSQSVIQTTIPRRADCRHNHELVVKDAVNLTDACVKLYELVEHSRKGSGRVTVDFHLDVMTSLICTRCGTSVRLLRALRGNEQNRRCPKCRGRVMAGMIRTNLSEEELQPFLDARLEEIGLPAAHIFSLRGDGVEVFYEFPGSKLAEVRGDGHRTGN